MTMRLSALRFVAQRIAPSIAWLPRFIRWLALFGPSQITLISVGVFFPVYLGVMGAVMSVDRKIVEVGRAFRLSGFAMVRRILLPAVLPAYVISLRSGLGLGWMFVVAAEFMGASEGLGYLVLVLNNQTATTDMFAVIVSLSMIGIGLFLIVSIVERLLLPWYYESREVESEGLELEPEEIR